MKEELKEYGLSEKEVEIYISCLKLGEATTSRISEVSNISRTTVYDILEGLKAKGIAHSFTKDKKQHYGVIEPKQLIEAVNKKADLIKNILPDLESIKGDISYKPKIEMFEGKEGLMQASFDMLKEKEIVAYGGSGKFDKVFEMFQANFARRRVENKVVLKAIIEEDIPEHMIEDDVRKYTQIKILKSFGGSNVSMFIYGDKVLKLIYGEEPIAIIITNIEYANFQRKAFEEMWIKT